MSDAIVVQITKGIETLIAAGVTAAAFSQEFTAERSYADWDLALKEASPPDVAGPIKLDIVGHTLQQAVDLTTRGLLEFTVVVDIAIRKALGTEATAQWTGQATTESVDPLMLLASSHQSDKPSEPGTPPHSKEGALPAAILFAVDAATLTAVVGPTRRKVGLAGKAHEFGGEFRGENYPARPFMAPAMLKTLDRFAGSFRGDIAE